MCGCSSRDAASTSRRKRCRVFASATSSRQNNLAFERDFEPLVVEDGGALPRIRARGIEDLRVGKLCAAIAGFALHAGVVVPECATQRREKLAPQALRPPLVNDRLSLQGRESVRHRRRRAAPHRLARPAPADREGAG
jgi:hypothetical protein